jgi:two-component system alkaline phosphatase synthesis response regulator PhoP
MKKIKLIIVDDDAAVREAWRKVLEKKDFDVLEASDGKKAFKMVKEERPDLLICDILIPHLDGLQLCEKIRDDDEVYETPIILMTGVYKDISFRLKTENLANDFIIKPFKEKELLEKIKKVLNP